MSKVEELLQAAKLNELLKKGEEDRKKKSTLCKVLAAAGIVAAIAAIAYAIYRYLTPDYLDEFEEDFDEDFDDDFFDDDDSEEDSEEEDSEEETSKEETSATEDQKASVEEA